MTVSFVPPTPSNVTFERLRLRLAPARDRVIKHALHGSLTTRARLRAFMESHVFAVWDFMALLKRLQRDLTSVTVPWLPPASSVAARLINEIVLGEETDRVDGFGVVSHFELYLRAMREVGADVAPVHRLLEGVRAGQDWSVALSKAEVPGPAATFVHQTFTLATRGQTHEVAAAFLFGREALVPLMFDALLTVLANAGRETTAFRAYLARHVEVDAGDHGPLAEQLLRALCGDDLRKWDEAETAALAALEARKVFWDDVLAALPA